MKISQSILNNLNETADSLWKSQIDNKSKEDLEKYLNKLYVRLSNSSEQTDSRNFYDLLKKIEYIENKTGIKSKLGRVLH